ncbi:CPBP family intramembrane glutamic endopeptidase [Clostridium neuense]|uniref:CPBP family intramembrane glutamic endopeptidase n=1 Tax=Clostridium neuense TaxID=1728934 RepID=A0ABW8THM8_9CLOT
MGEKLTLRDKYLKLKTGVRILICFEIIIIPTIIFSIILPPSLSKYTQEIMFIAVPIFMWKVVEGKSLNKMGFTHERKSVGDFIIGLLFGVASISAVFVILLASGNISFAGSIFKPHITIGTLLDIVLFIMVGFAEEIFCRGYCLRSIYEKNGSLMAVIISSVIFSALHFGNPNVTPLFFVNVVLIGILFSYMALEINIWLPIGFHAMWDYFEGNVWGLPNSGNLVRGIYDTKLTGINIINGGLVGPEGGLAVTLIILIGFLIVYLIKDNKELKS